MDMIETLISSLESNTSSDNLTEDDIVDEFVTFFMAGMDTTAHLASFVPYYFATNQEYYQRAEKEVAQNYGKGESNTTLDNV